jgi:hypothetical protein
MNRRDSLQTTVSPSELPTRRCVQGPEHNRKRPPENETSGRELLEQRRAKNRTAAHQSRIRKMEQQNALYDLFVTLSSENEELKRVNESIATELFILRVENKSYAK